MSKLEWWVTYELKLLIEQYKNCVGRFDREISKSHLKTKKSPSFFFVFFRCLFWTKRCFGCTWNHCIHKSCQYFDFKWKKTTLFSSRTEEHLVLSAHEKLSDTKIVIILNSNERKQYFLPFIKNTGHMLLSSLESTFTFWKKIKFKIDYQEIIYHKNNIVHV